MLTADTITDEQIRELRDSLDDSLCEADPKGVTQYECDIALGQFRGGRMGSSRSEERQARARCAEILNARTGVQS